MTIDEAIKLLRKDIDNPGSVAIEDVNKAEELSIEALKRCRTLAQESPLWALHPLPGETKD